MSRPGDKCAVVGAGVIGIACGIRLLDRGYAVTLYDPHPPGSMTSSGNAGAFAYSDVMPMAAPGTIRKAPMWLLDPCGPLFIRPVMVPALLPWFVRFCRASRKTEVDRLASALSSLMSTAPDDTRRLVARAGLESLMCGEGAITLYRSLGGFRNERLEWEIKARHGIHVEELGADDIREMEPAVENAACGRYTRDWQNTSDPYALSSGLADFFVRCGGRIRQCRVDRLRQGAGRVRALVLEGGDEVAVDRVVIAAGAWSGMFCRQLGERVLLASERGYNTTLPTPGVALNRQLIFGEEKFVVSRIGNGLRIGGAAEFAGLDAPPNHERSARLLGIARNYLPALDIEGGVPWMGHRPSTPDSIPVIGPSAAADNVIYGFGHGHYGLTLAATTARLVARIAACDRVDIDIAPFSITRFR